MYIFHSGVFVYYNKKISCFFCLLECVEKSSVGHYIICNAIIDTSVL
jgi:hypothetical protein